MKCWLVLAWLLPVASCGPVAKRSDDSNPLEAVVNKLASDLQALQAKVTALSTVLDVLKVNVGFAAYIGHEIHMSQGATVKFEDIHYNAGNAYDPMTGLFTAPVAGMYNFFIKSEVDARNQIALTILKGNHEILYIYAADHDSYQTSSGDIVVPLAQGDRIWVETTQDSKVRTLTLFGGFLVHPDV